MPRVQAYFHRQRRTVFAVRLRFYPSLDPAQVLARKTCLFSIRFVLNGHLFNLTIVRLLNHIDMFIIKSLCFFVHYIRVTLFDFFVASGFLSDLYSRIVWRFSDRNTSEQVIGRKVKKQFRKFVICCLLLVGGCCFVLFYCYCYCYYYYIKPKDTTVDNNMHLKKSFTINIKISIQKSGPCFW